MWFTPTCCQEGWTFATGSPAPPATGCSATGTCARSISCGPEASGRVTVPILWDKERGTIVSNESSEIIRMFNSAFDPMTGNRRRLLAGNRWRDRGGERTDLKP